LLFFLNVATRWVGGCEEISLHAKHRELSRVRHRLDGRMRHGDERVRRRVGVAIEHQIRALVADLHHVMVVDDEHATRAHLIHVVGRREHSAQSPTHVHLVAVVLHLVRSHQHLQLVLVEEARCDVGAETDAIATRWWVIIDTINVRSTYHERSHDITPHAPAFRRRTSHHAGRRRIALK
jgi:hypothetical protein